MKLEAFMIPMVCVQITVLLYTIVRSVRLIGSGERSMAVVFFLFAAFSLLISDLYWITYDLLRPDTRMPFAANEIGEGAALLLLGSALNAVFRPGPGTARREMALAALFAGACTALWIGWSGEWADDILTGVCLGYLLCSTVRALKLSDALSRTQWLTVCIGAAVLIAGQAATFFVPEAVRGAVDLGCYALMMLGIVFFFVNAVRTIAAGVDSRKMLGLCFACYGWSLSAMYMSDALYYVIAYISITVSLALIMLAVRKEVEA